MSSSDCPFPIRVMGSTGPALTQSIQSSTAITSIQVRTPMNLDYVRTNSLSLKAKFEDIVRVAKTWITLIKEGPIREYLQKLINQGEIAVHLLTHADRITARTASKIGILLEHADRKEIRDMLAKKAADIEVLKQSQKKILQTEAKALPTPATKKFWEWLGPDGSWNPYSLLHSQFAEKHQFEPHVPPLKINDYLYQLDFNRNVQINLTTKKERKIRCVLDVPIPTYWIGYNASLESTLVTVSDQSHAELQQIVEAFREGCPSYQITSMAYNVNPGIWAMFKRFEDITTRRLKENVVRGLWHGTDVNTVKLICAQGFRRQFAKKTIYGKGVYFARSPAYSCSPEYAKPDVTTKEQTLIYSYVIVGEPALGSKDLTQPPLRSDTSIPYETTVDKLEDPSIFVAYDDAQAFPAVVLTVKKNGC